MDRLSSGDREMVVGGTPIPQSNLRPSVQALLEAIEGYSSLPSGFSSQLAQDVKSRPECR